MTFKILCTSFEAPTWPYQIKQTMKIGQEIREKKQFLLFLE